MSSQKPRPTVLVLMGGPDAEREVSLMSGREVAAALRESGRYDVIEQVIDHPAADELRDLGGDVVFPALHGKWGEGGPLQEMLETLAVPYVGSAAAAAALAMDKLATKQAVAAAGVPIPTDQALAPGDHCDLEPPLVLKPIDDGSSVDLHICHTPDQIAHARELLHPRHGRILAERYIAGREITVGIVCGAALPLVEIVPAVEFYDYQAKYFRDDTQYIVDPDLGDELTLRCTGAALRSFDVIGGRDLARADFMVDDDEGLWFLEINTMPGFTTHSLVPMAAASRGLDMPALCARLVAAALSRVEPVTSHAVALES